MSLSKIISVITVFTLLSCKEEINYKKPADINFDEEMRSFVIGLSEYAKSEHPGFYIFPQNGVELITTDKEEDGMIHQAYMAAIDGHGQEDLFYGYNEDDLASPKAENLYLCSFLDRSKENGKLILITDYCSTPSKMDDSYQKNIEKDYVSFAASDRELQIIPQYPNPIVNENATDINSLSQVQNFLYLLNLENYSSKSDFINSVNKTNYDLLIMDAFFKENVLFSATEIDQLRIKANGGSRVVLAYMSIGEAEDYRYYWKSSWLNVKPDWLALENPDWKGNYKVEYWNSDWQTIIYGHEDAYLDKILEAKFDGVYLDIIDAFEFFDEL